MAQAERLVPVRSRRMAESVIEQLVNLIRQGNLHPGDRLPSERELAQKLRVSRVVVREALMYMQQAGIVHTRHGSGTYVSGGFGDDRTACADSAAQDRLTWLFEFRLGVEGEAAALAARRASGTELKQLAQALERLQSEVAGGRLGVEADFDFHVAIARASGNPYLVSSLTNVTDLLMRSVTVSRVRSLAVPGRPETVLAEHQAIYNGIAAGNGEAARHAMREHLQAALGRLLAQGE
ncbi:MAG: FadR family transcriptional regulator [Firmicutes bacterium]|nr:FadR family transcriptional regulator [Bacillota bacterium]